MTTPPTKPAAPELGLIDGRFGRPWSWEERHEVVGHLARAGYGFYHHGPKADRYLRRTWREPHPVEEIDRLTRLADHCRAHGLRFGVALTPMDAPQPFDADTRAALDAKLDSLAAIGLDDLAILFDDLRGDAPGLAEAQADIVSHIGARTGARLFFCPTYYSDDPVLDRVFGQRPADYLATLGRRLDPSVRIYWTGEEVCAREISPGHLDRVAEQLGLEGHAERCLDCPCKRKCKFYLDLRKGNLKTLYLDCEKYDGYIRDQCVFGKTMDIAIIYTIIAGLLNYFVIYDAIAGPALKEEEEQELASRGGIPPGSRAEKVT